MQTDGKRAVQIQERLRGVFAGIGNTFFPLTACLLDQLVIGILQEVFKIF